MPDVPSGGADQVTGKLAEDCCGSSVPMLAPGACVSRTMPSDMALLGLWSRSRNFTKSVLGPSPAVSWNRVLVAYGCQLAPANRESSDSAISVTRALSDADNATVTVRDVA